MKKFNVFQMNVDKMVELNAENLDFAPASEDEKSSMLESHASVSYWHDAFRRFKANKVSVAAFFVFVVILLFAFAGPYLIPYTYADQFRNAAKLGPFQYSDAEQTLNKALAEADGAFYTQLVSGSMTYIKKGDYFFTFKGKTYAFTLADSLEKTVFLFDADADSPFSMVDDAAFLSGEYEKTPIALSGAPAEGATEFKLRTSVFPHMFGTDSSGRDLMARSMYGARVSIIIGIVAALIVLVIGAAYGAISGLGGGMIDFVMMRIIDLIYSVPDVLIVLLLQVVLKDPLQAWFDASSIPIVRAMSDLGVGIVSIFITFALLYWVGMARIVRGQVLMLKQQEYVTAAKALGVSSRKVITRHLIPNCIGQLVITTCLQIPSAIFLESFLSFLGLGVSAPMASLGSMCSDAIDTITLYPYRLLLPAIVLTILVLSLNLVGDGLRDALDPRLKK
jgi:ABC-type dipeptide/oligopeptide/nickel transport system permease subunit